MFSPTLWQSVLFLSQEPSAINVLLLSTTLAEVEPVDAIHVWTSNVPHDNIDRGGSRGGGVGSQESRDPPLI